MSAEEGLRHTSEESAADAFELPNRRPTFILNTPALVAHHVFWFSPEHKNWAVAEDHFKACKHEYVSRLRNGSEQRIAPDPKLVIAAVINSYMQRFAAVQRGGIRKVPLFSIDRESNDETIHLARMGNHDKDTDLSVAPDRTLAYEDIVGDFAFELTADIFREHFTLSYRLFPLATEDPNYRVSNSDNHTRATQKRPIERSRDMLWDLADSGRGALERVRDNLDDWDVPTTYQETREGPRGLDAADAQANYWADTLYQQVWTEFFEHLDQALPSTDPNLPESFDPAEFVDKPWFPAHLAGVFRNVVIRTMPNQGQRAYFEELNKDRKMVELEGDRSIVLRHVPEGVVGHVNERARLALDGLARADRESPNNLIRGRVTEHLNHRSVFFGRVLGFRGTQRWIEDLQSGNATLSAMLDGLAVHGSTLGLHSSDDKNYPHREVRQFLVYGGPSRQQLGRLCRELHAVGEYRLLALRGFRNIEEAGRALDPIFDGLNDVDQFLTQGHPEEATHRLGELNTELQKVKESVPDGGLLHRLIQPEVCTKHLKRHLRTLRINRLEGWRPFDEFVARSIEPHVGFIEAIRSYLEELEAGLRDLEARSATLRSEKLTTQINGVVEYIGSVQGRLEQQSRQITALAIIATGAGVLGGTGGVVYSRYAGDQTAPLANYSEIGYLFDLLSVAGLTGVLGGAIFLFWPRRKSKN